MKRTYPIVTLILAGMLSMTAGARDGFMAAQSDYVLSAQADIKLARLTEEEKRSLRKRWQNLPPEMRDEVRRQLREETRQPDEGYGQGYEYRRSDDMDERDDRHDSRRLPLPWGKPRR